MTDKVTDPRNITAGCEIPSEGYCDQPYLVKTDDGHWLVTMTTGTGEEGDPGQHIITARSSDKGKTWIDRADVEPAKGPEASYSVVFKTPYGRIYCLYNYNGDRVSEVKREDSGVFKRVDSLGSYVFKYSDDNGKTWSAKRYEIPVREFECDRNNVYGGKLRFFWNVGRPITTKDGQALFVLHKVGAMGKGFFAQSEGAFLKSDNILTERNPEKIHFITLPDGDIGLRAPEGGSRVAEEQTVVELSDGSLYCVYRTIDGYPACAYSRDGGHTWTKPDFARYTPDGRKMKHPRAANFVWKCANGKYLYWYHNHGGERFIKNQPEWKPYADRNPAWISGGVEKDGHIIWSQPEILLYDAADQFTRMSYPDLIEDDGYFVTETQKTIARVHAVDASLIEGLWAQFEAPKQTRSGMILELIKPEHGTAYDIPALPALTANPHLWGARGTPAGFSIEISFTASRIAGGTILDNRGDNGKGFALTLNKNGTVKIILNDGRTETSWECDTGLITPGVEHHVTVVVDGSAKIILFVVNGVLCDGGENRQFGWGRMYGGLLDVNAGQLRTPSFNGKVSVVRFYDRALRVSEAIGNYRSE
ncbi:MAG: exo-alpha-sialidase [Spirochaetes bacterium]|nr:exo-alpha-sialidase [Spirochaetota bacterium]